jgi:TusA-related sulfurtransferase
MAVKELDVSREHSPMTFVRVRLALDDLPEGDVLRVTARGEYTARKIISNAVELGCKTRILEGSGMSMHVIDIERA